MSKSIPMSGRWGCGQKREGGEGKKVLGWQKSVSLGHRKTTLCLIRNGRPIMSRTLPMGGRAITEAIALDRGMGSDRAVVEFFPAGPPSDLPPIDRSSP